MEETSPQRSESSQSKSDIMLLLLFVIFYRISFVSLVEEFSPQRSQRARSKSDIMLLLLFVIFYRISFVAIVDSPVTGTYRCRSR
jgi:hypothetical protein